MEKKVSLFHKQEQAFKQQAKIVVYIGGIQSGKTTLGGVWSTHKAFTEQPQTNQIIVAPTYKMLSQATLPRFLQYSAPFGEYKKVDQEFHWNNGSISYIRTATDPDIVEGITNVKSIWGDEAGKFSKYFFENLMGRAAFARGQIMLTTTGYALNWLFELVNDSVAGKRNDVAVVQCRSIDSPYFPMDEYNRQKKLLDPRRFKMKYDGEFGEMEGIVYDQITYERAFPIENAKYYLGVDFGYTDPFALVMLAKTPMKTYVIDEFYKSHLTPAQCIEVIEHRMRIYKFQAIYCDPSQPGMIKELQNHGIPAMPANNDIVVGVGKVYELLSNAQLIVFNDVTPHLCDELSMYHYPEPRELAIDQSDIAKEKVPVDKNNHACDALRYVVMGVYEHFGSKQFSPTYADPMKRPESLEARIKWLKAGGSSR